MKPSVIHMVLMYATEIVAIALLVLWVYLGRIEPLVFSLMFLVISATFHITYLLSEVYEKLENLERRIGRSVR